MTMDMQAAIEDEAGLWLVKIDGRELSQEETRELLSWVRRSDYHRDYLLRLARQWDSMMVLSKLSTLFPVEGFSAAPQQRPEPTGIAGIKAGLATLTNAWQPLAAFCVMLVLVAGWQSGYFLGGALFPQTYQTATGETRSHTLADGSVITLNTNSQLSVSYTQKQRRVTLLRGEAHFEVAKNKTRPFKVYAASGLVQAVGTAFNVRLLSASEVDVIVTEGRVNVVSQVDTASDKAAVAGPQALVDAGQRLQYNPLAQVIQPVAASAEVLERELAWQQGTIIFQGETLEQAVAEIARYTDKRLTIADAALKNLPVGGRYQTDNIDALLLSLADVMGMHVDYPSADTIQLSARPKNNVKKIKKQ